RCAHHALVAKLFNHERQSGFFAFTCEVAAIVLDVLAGEHLERLHFGLSLEIFFVKALHPVGKKPTPASRKATLSLGKRSSTPYDIMETMESICSKGCEVMCTPRYL